MGEVASPGMHLRVYQVNLLRPFINYASRCIAHSETHLFCCQLFTVTIPVSLADQRVVLSVQKSKFFDCLTLQLLKSENFQLIFAHFCSLIFSYGNQHKIEGFPSFRVTEFNVCRFWSESSYTQNVLHSIWCRKQNLSIVSLAVSYTHLTLPTIYSV